LLRHTVKIKITVEITVEIKAFLGLWASGPAFRMFEQ
jgi:hypothetical protein